MADISSAAMAHGSRYSACAAKTNGLKRPTDDNERE